MAKIDRNGILKNWKAESSYHKHSIAPEFLKNSNQHIHIYATVGFWCQGIHRKFLRRFDTSIGIKMMMKIYAIQPERLVRLVRPGQLAGNSERARGISKKFQWHIFSLSFLCQNWCQIFVRIFCVCALKTYSNFLQLLGF